jgi:hypothetical protein
MGVNYKSIEWVVCGSTEESEGCFDSGRLGRFGEAGAMIEGDPSVEGLTVVRHIYVVDVAAGASGNDVELYVYRKTDSISASYDKTTVRLINSLALPLVGGATAKAFLAAGEQYLYVGTNFSECRAANSQVRLERHASRRILSTCRGQRHHRGWLRQRHNYLWRLHVRRQRFLRVRC